MCVIVGLTTVDKLAVFYIDMRKAVGISLISRLEVEINIFEV